MYLALGQALTSQGKFDEAIVQYREALRLAPAPALVMRDGKILVQTEVRRTFDPRVPD